MQCNSALGFLLRVFEFLKNKRERKGLLALTMSSSEQELEEQLKETGNSLLNTPSATDELLKLLDVMPPLLSLCIAFSHTIYMFTGLFYALMKFSGMPSV